MAEDSVLSSVRTPQNLPNLTRPGSFESTVQRGMQIGENVDQEDNNLNGGGRETAWVEINLGAIQLTAPDTIGGCGAAYEVGVIVFL